MTDRTRSAPDRYINRELSWLAFNERVLEEAADATTPLLERLKFAAIVASNLDEFFMVRVAGLRHAIADGDVGPDLAGLTPAQQLTAIAERAHAMVDALYRLTFDEIMPAFASVRRAHHRLVEISSRRSRSRWATSFASEILPVLTPLAIDASRPFPLLASLSLNLALLLAAAPGESEPRLAIVQVPSGLARLVPVGEPRGVRAARRDHLGPRRAAVSRTADSGVGGHPPRPRFRAGARRRGRPNAPGAGRARIAPAAPQQRHAPGDQRRRLEAARRPAAHAPRDHRRRRLRRARTARLAGVDGPDRSAGNRRAARPGASAGRRPGQRRPGGPVLARGGAAAAPASSLRCLRSGHRAGGAGGRRSRCARHQADAVPDQRRIAVHRLPAARRRAQQAGHGAGGAHRPLRRRAQHPLGPRPRGSRRARDLRRARLQDPREDLPHRPAQPGGPEAVRPPRHRQLQRADGAHLHRLRADHDVAGDRRRRDGVLQCGDRLFRSAALEEAGDGAHRPPPAVSQADRSRAPPGPSRASRRRSSPR